VDRICPLLAMAGDRRTVCDGYDPNHRCWSASAPPALDRAQQLDVCLTSGHASCPYLDSPVAGVDQALPADLQISRSRIVIETDGAWLGLASRSVGVAARRRMLVVGVTVVAAAALATSSGSLAAVGGFAADLQRASAMTAPLGRTATSSASTPSPSVQATATPAVVSLPSVQLTPAAVPSPSQTSSPTHAPTPTQAPTLPPAATAAPAAQRYVVQPGDTLSRIADRFGVSVQALQQANGIADQNVISVGQTLIIPAA
jgi:LysM repeat protein